MIHDPWIETNHVIDIIHGTIPITHLISKFIDTYQFQRLKRLKTIGLSSNGFINANHTRAEHSLGVSYPSCKWSTLIWNKHQDKQCRLVRICNSYNIWLYTVSWKRIIKTCVFIHIIMNILHAIEACSEKFGMNQTNI